jgi:hypothetical protein
VRRDEIEVIPGVVGPREFRAFPVTEPYTGHELAVLVRFDERLRRYTCDELCLARGEGGPPITTESLRQVPIGVLIDSSIRISLLVDFRDAPGDMPDTALRDLPNPDGREPWGRVPPQGLAKEGPTDRSLQWVAHLYRLSVALGEQPTATVQELMGLSRATAGRWVGTARERGYLGAAALGKAGEQTG